jgi:hypothetical protein
MSRSDKEARRAAPPPGVDPWFAVRTAGAEQGSTLDPSGYSTSDISPGLPERYTEDHGPTAGGYLGEAGANSTSAGLGMDSTKGEWLGGQFAQTPAPLEYRDGGSPDDVTRDHADPRSPEARTRAFGLSDPGARL